MNHRNSDKHNALVARIREKIRLLNGEDFMRLPWHAKYITKNVCYIEIK